MSYLFEQYSDDDDEEEEEEIPAEGEEGEEKETVSYFNPETEIKVSDAKKLDTIIALMGQNR